MGTRKIKEIVARAEYKLLNPNYSKPYKDKVAVEAVHKIYWLIGADWERTHKEQGISGWPEEREEMRRQNIIVTFNINFLIILILFTSEIYLSWSDYPNQNCILYFLSIIHIQNAK